MAGFPDSPPRPDRARPARPAGARSTLFLVLLLVALVVSGPLAAGRAVKRIASALHHVFEAPALARERVLGAPYVQAIAAIRTSIPANGAYALVEGGDPADGGALWVRYELAPRKAIDLGRLPDLPAPSRLESDLAAEVEWAVVSRGRYETPALLTRDQLLHLPAAPIREPLAP
jgi:hypothetical protein